MPPTTSVSEPTMPRKALKANMNAVHELEHLVVSQNTQRLFVVGSKAMSAGQDSSYLGGRLLGRCTSLAVKMNRSTYFWPVRARKVEPG